MTIKSEHFNQRKWHRSQLMAFSGIDGQTRYRDELVARTVVAPAGLEIVMPARCRIVFAEEPAADILVSSDWFRFTTSTGTVEGAFLDCDHLLIQGDCRVGIETASDAIACLRKNGRLLLGIKKRFRPELIDDDLPVALAARGEWIGRLGIPADLPMATQRTLFRAFSMMKGQVYAPEGKIRSRWTTPDRWPHYDMWLWDSGFHAIGLRHLDPVLAMEAIGAMFDAQRDDGFLAHRANIHGAASHITQPPVLAFAARLVYDKSRDLDWLRGLYPKLRAYVLWDLANRDTDGGGLAEWVIDDDPRCRSGESGMDNSPRFDEATLLDAVDFNAFLALECETLAEIAGLLSLPGEQAGWSARHRKLCRLMNERLWSEADGFYFDYDPAKASRTEVWSSAGLLPLICEAPSREQAARLVRALADPGCFGTAFPIPSIAVCSGKYYSKDMWRGPVWININWLVVHGLERYGFTAEAAALREKTIREIERGCEDYGVFFEYFDDRREVDSPRLLRKEICDPENGYRQAIHDFGWTATCYVDLVLARGRAG